ncbi:hypothetical protein POPTR_018G147749v4 [Populus trichocarpa]|jgi:hypothetical protein|uniref:Uncharacterized protein n=1 Tax=Populus trichocarpa TaxID=3694 RepID=A0ACC0RPV4_POPTR|nr:hypothetical protein POPTR_018G147749v4 [Populus trichocarpa]
MEMVEVDEVEDVMTTEKMAEIPIKVLCAGMSVANSSLTEFAIGSAEGYAEYVIMGECHCQVLQSSSRNRKKELEVNQ